MRIVSAQIGHETNTFASTPTTLQSFQLSSVGATPHDDLQQGFPIGEPLLDALRGTRTIHGGYIAGASEQGWQLEPLLLAWATPSGMVCQSAYDLLKGLLLERLAAAGEYHGVLLDLHGAMVTEGLEDAEGNLIQAVRGVVGEEMPIIVTLDLHANSTSRMAQFADAIIGFDEYPHTDMFERGLEAAEVMAKILSGEIRPTLAYQQLPLMTQPPKQCTLREPMLSLLAKAHALEQEENVVNVTLSMGFPYADIRDTGVSVFVTTNNAPELAQRKAAEMAQAIWKVRDDFNVSLTPVTDAIDFAQNEAEGLVILADGSDNPGGGGPCDGTVILRELIDRDVQDAVVAVIADPEAVSEAITAGVGNAVTLDLGGKTDDRHGSPIHLTAHIKLISDGTFVQRGPMGRGVRARMGRAAVLAIGGVEVVVTERRIQPYDVALLRSVGIEPTERRFIALKSAVHHSYDRIKGDVLVVP